VTSLDPECSPGRDRCVQVTCRRGATGRHARRAIRSGGRPGSGTHRPTRVRAVARRRACRLRQGRLPVYSRTRVAGRLERVGAARQRHGIEMATSCSTSRRPASRRTAPWRDCLRRQGRDPGATLATGECDHLARRRELSASWWISSCTRQRTTIRKALSRRASAPVERLVAFGVRVDGGTRSTRASRRQVQLPSESDTRDGQQRPHDRRVEQDARCRAGSEHLRSVPGPEASAGTPEQNQGGARDQRPVVRCPRPPRRWSSGARRTLRIRDRMKPRSPSTGRTGTRTHQRIQNVIAPSRGC